jgi:hypothetical protein
MPQRRRGKKRGFSKRRGGSRAPAGFSRLQPIMPSKKHVPLRVISTAIISGASPSVVKRWNPNSAYTPETGGGSGATPGYADLAQLYGYYRVAGYSYEVTISNLEAFGVVVYCVNSNADPTTSVNSTIASNPKCQSSSLSPKGGFDRHVFRGRFTIESIVGSPAVKWDDLYAALINANPADVTWLGIGVQSIGGANLTNGVCCEVKILQYTIFYDYLLQIYSQVMTRVSNSSNTSDSSFSSIERMLDEEDDDLPVINNSVAATSLAIKPYIQIKATQEKEQSDFIQSEKMYTFCTGVPVPLTILMQRNKKVQGYVPFTVVY